MEIYAQGSEPPTYHDPIASIQLTHVMERMALEEESHVPP